MIKKIGKIKHLGIFGDYSWNSGLAEFKRYNLVYGGNGSGKTTLANLLDALQAGGAEKYPNLEYAIESEEGRIEQGVAYSRNVRVFNKDYIANNIQLLHGKAKPIFILGEDNKKLAEAIEKDEQSLRERLARLRKVEEDKKTQEDRIGKHFTDIARSISSNTSGEATRRYNKNNAETAFNALNEKQLLEATDIETNSLTLRQLELGSVEELTIPKVESDDEGIDLADHLTDLVTKGKLLCSKTVASVVIDRLKQNEDISAWVEEGLSLHQKHKSTTCEYCNSAIPEKRINELAQHFNEADKQLKTSIDSLITKLSSVSTVIQIITTVDKANLYKELQSEYEISVEAYATEKASILSAIASFSGVLEAKKSKTTDPVVLDEPLSLEPFCSVINKVNAVAKKHNSKTENFKNEKALAQGRLEKHYLSSIYDDVKGLKVDIQGKANEILTLTNGNPETNETGITDLTARITEDKSKISSSHKACKEINDSIRAFLGRNEIVFEIEDEGYVIKRNGIVVEDLSEGEKTAITFVYFTVHLRDQEFDIGEGVIVVDDPVSSLDSSSLYQAFAFLKNAVKDAHQVFLFTHNYDFLRLLLNWLNFRSLKPHRSLYMLRNHYVESNRTIEITALDKLLQNHESEYHYLFKRLYEFNGDGSIESVYDIPNLARKVLDTFLMFRVPNSKSQYEKLNELDFDENKKTTLYKFTNDQSHITGKGFEPSLVEETQKNVKYLCEMMEAVFPEHFRILKETITN